MLDDKVGEDDETLLNFLVGSGGLANGLLEIGVDLVVACRAVRAVADTRDVDDVLDVLLEEGGFADCGEVRQGGCGGRDVEDIEAAVHFLLVGARREEGVEVDVVLSSWREGLNGWLSNCCVLVWLIAWLTAV